MSIVPYNSNKQIVYQDSSKGILVIHNDSENTLDLVRASPSLADRTRRCPNCGYTLHDDDDSKLPISPTTPEKSRKLDDFDMGMKSSNFTHQDYFKLLADLPDLESVEQGSKFTRTSLPGSIFNQGYFSRFFRKIPPYILGSGAHAQVFKVIHVLNDILLGTYAVKRICIGDQLPLLQQVLNEVVILYELSVQGANENNLIQYNHVWLEMGELSDLKAFIVGEFGTSGNGSVPYVYILQQYCDGGHLEALVSHFLPENFTLKEKVSFERERRRKRRMLMVSNGHQDRDDSRSEKKWLNDLEILKFFLDVFNGVSYLHRNGILHRDLKPLNCLLETEYYFELEDATSNSGFSYESVEMYLQKLPKVLVSDFGEGQFLNKRKQAMSNEKYNERRGNTGTLEFTSPELWIYDKPDHLMNDFTFESDIYSLGLILCWLCLGRLPFSDYIEDYTDPQKVRRQIMDWYFSVTKEGFDEWFKKELSAQKRSRSAQLEAFMELIYEMIRREEGEQKKVSVPEIMRLLEEIKWSFVESGPQSRNNSLSDSARRFVVPNFGVAVVYVAYCIAFFLADYACSLNVKLYAIKLIVLVLGLWEIFQLQNNRWALVRASCILVFCISIAVAAQTLST